MKALFILIGISTVVSGGFLTAFLWSVKSGQYDDDYTPSVRMLFDDSSSPDTNNTASTTNPISQQQKVKIACR